MLEPPFLKEQLQMKMEQTQAWRLGSGHSKDCFIEQVVLCLGHMCSGWQGIWGWLRIDCLGSQQRALGVPRACPQGKPRFTSFKIISFLRV